ncbi:hypothetical protein LCGC14_2201750 [marine sediment metagenome]|uniref:Uncharacterized protein n=1 Tax=marine sediment metagenome TaxID=412755 RepID=A0A0F9GCE6_9ZZZZ
MIVLASRTLPARTKLTGEDTTIVILSGGSIKVETSPGGIEVLNATCPTGKTWKVAISVSIDEE